MIWLLLALLFVWMNLVAFLAFRNDKLQAIAGDRRIAERHLIMLAMLGGWFGAKLAQRRFRHKTRKQPFARVLNSVPAIWVGFAIALFLIGSDLRLPDLGIAFDEPSAEADYRPTPRFFQRAGG